MLRRHRASQLSAVHPPPSYNAAAPPRHRAALLIPPLDRWAAGPTPCPCARAATSPLFRSAATVPIRYRCFIAAATGPLRRCAVVPLNNRRSATVPIPHYRRCHHAAVALPPDRREAAVRSPAAAMLSWSPSVFTLSPRHRRAVAVCRRDVITQTPLACSCSTALSQRLRATAPKSPHNHRGTTIRFARRGPAQVPRRRRYGRHRPAPTATRLPNPRRLSRPRSDLRCHSHARRQRRDKVSRHTHTHTHAHMVS